MQTTNMRDHRFSSTEEFIQFNLYMVPYLFVFRTYYCRQNIFFGNTCFVLGLYHLRAGLHASWAEWRFSNIFHFHVPSSWEIYLQHQQEAVEPAITQVSALSYTIFLLFNYSLQHMNGISNLFHAHVNVTKYSV